MAVCGGLLGLFLGLSTLSIVEFVYRVAFRLFRMIRQSKSKNDEYKRNFVIKTNTIQTINAHYRV